MKELAPFESLKGVFKGVVFSNNKVKHFLTIKFSMLLKATCVQFMFHYTENKWC